MLLRGAKMAEPEVSAISTPVSNLSLTVKEIKQSGNCIPHDT
jgi:hypothetical protein